MNCLTSLMRSSVGTAMPPTITSMVVVPGSLYTPLMQPSKVSLVVIIARANGLGTSDRFVAISPVGVSFAMTHLADMLDQAGVSCYTDVEDRVKLGDGTELLTVTRVLNAQGVALLRHAVL